MTDKDDLFKGIDAAADNLFSQYIVKKSTSPEPTQVEPVAASDSPDYSGTSQSSTDLSQEPPANPPPIATVQEPVLDLEFSLSEPIAFEKEVDLLDQMEEALLSIDWEVSPKNLAKGREILAQLAIKHDFTPTTPAGLLTEQMDKVLASMLQYPENVPVSAPSQIKKALEAIRIAIAQGATPNAEIRKLLSQALSELHAVVAPPPAESVTLDFNLRMEGDVSAPEPIVPQMPSRASSAPTAEPIPDFDLELSLESGGGTTGSGQPVAADTAMVLRSYSSCLATAIKGVTPMVSLFANRAGMEKLYNVNEQVREKLSGQERLLAQTFSADYSTYNGIGTVNGWLESQLDILNPCVKRLAKVEALFAKTKGYEKVHELTRSVRKALTEQQENITKAVGGTSTIHQFDLTGEYPALQPVLDRTPEVSLAAVSAVTDPQRLLDSCISIAQKIESGEDDIGPEIGRKLRESLEKIKAALAGSAISSPGATAAALASASRHSKCRWDWLLKTTWAGQLVGMAPEQVVFESHATFSVKAFKDMTHFPLKKLKSLPWTNLQNLFSGELAEIDKATLNSMELEIAKPPGTFRGSSQKKVHVIIMYAGGKGKVFLVDTQTEAISIADEGVWNPGAIGSEIAGTLTVYGSIMPVIAID
ncbi:MAG: hypothetical protein HGA96_03320 [Desulfobulbaceae bacterium]|nr:hypothetical protein [Desulfobulbaceae bacterium]